jgi:hypothetical protein
MTRFTPCSLLLVLFITFPLRAEPLVQLHASITPAQSANGLQMIFMIDFRVKSGNDWIPAEDLILAITLGAPYDSRSYELTDPKGNPIPVTPTVEAGELLAGHIRLVPKEAPKPSEQYSFKVLPGKLVFQVPVNGITVTETNAGASFILKGSDFQQNFDYFEREKAALRQSSFQLLGGSLGGVLTAKLILDQSRFLDVDWMNLRLEGDADITLSVGDRTNYFNNITGDLSLYRSFEFLGRYSEIDVHGKTESDQTFEMTDVSAGARYALYPKDPITTTLGSIFVRTNDHAGALLILGYDYVKHAAGNSTIQTSTGINTHEADNRASAILRWRVPVARDYDFSFLPALGGRYDLDIDLELKGVYDIEASHFLDQSRVSLQFTRAFQDRFKPAFVFTWARGKEAPTFREVSALLAGMKLSF